MSAILLVPSSIEPCSVVEAKQFLRVEHDADDAVIAALIAAARGQVEALTRRALLAQRWRVTLDRWPLARKIRPRLAPLRAVAAARLFDAMGNAHALDSAGFAIDAASDAIVVPDGVAMPGRAQGGIELDVDCGYGNDPTDVPELLRQAVRALVSHWYENRGLIAIGQSVAMMPLSVSAMISSFRVLSL